VWAIYAYDVVCSGMKTGLKQFGWDLPSGQEGREGWPVVSLLHCTKTGPQLNFLNEFLSQSWLKSRPDDFLPPTVDVHFMTTSSRAKVNTH
jgi:hypothetical protein